MKVVDFSQTNTVVNRFIAELRDVNVQNDKMRFRRNIERIGEIIAYEISKQLHYEEQSVTTPLGVADVTVPNDQLVLGTILRAGLPLHQGLLNVFDDAENAFVSAYRNYDENFDFDIHVACRAAGVDRARLLHHALAGRENPHSGRPDACHRFVDGTGVGGPPEQRRARNAPHRLGNRIARGCKLPAGAHARGRYALGGRR